MKFSEQTKLAAYNLIKSKKTTAQSVVMIAFIMLLVFLCSFFIGTLVWQLSDNLDNYASKNYLDIKHTVFDDFAHRDTVLLDATAQAELKERFSTVTDINYYQSRNISVWVTEQDLILDGVTYHGNGANADYWWQFVLKAADTATFSANERIEFAKKFPQEQLIKYGRDIQNANEVLLPEEILEAYDITPEQLFAADKITYNTLFSDVKVVGIVNAKFVDMVNGGEERDVFTEIFIFAEESIAVESDFYLYISTYQRIELSSAGQVREIIAYLSNLFGDDYWVTYGNSAKLNKLELINKILTFVTNIVVTLAGIIGFALVLFLYSVFQHTAKQRGAYFAMMRAMGMEKVRSVRLIEIAIMTFAAAVICLIIALPIVLILKGTVIAFSWFTTYKIVVNGAIFTLTFVAAAALIFALNIALALMSAKNKKSKSISAELKG